MIVEPIVLNKKKRNPAPRKPRTKRKVRFWWDVYRTLVTTPTLRDALGLDRTWNETLERYKLWGNVVGVRYDDWWKEHRGLFIDEEPAVREITTSHFKRDQNCLYLELNLKRTPTSLFTMLRSLLRTKSKALKRGKNKTRVQTVFSFTPEAEIRPSVYDEYLRFLKKVYAPNCRMRANQLREVAHNRFKGKKDVFLSLHLDSSEDKEPIAYISVARYLKKVRLLCRSVAHGEFPGHV